ncbi:hypothetical protein B0H16DRAFT_1453152 [Mycena metata]|uniref:Uncharacterized protein n=1 Tax=Mycena metata TaxID=1033252 RepID=A0AAD7JR58_9AGAR|nr:hypothetical protein B0H16DRAFT_1453152 [Mycena metata]
MTVPTKPPTILVCDFPTEHGEVRTALQAKSTPAILANNGKGAPCVWHQDSCKISDPYHKCTPVPGILPLGPEKASSSATPMPSSSTPVPESPTVLEQTTLQDNWGQTKITSTRQATINYFLLCMVICCALAFSLLDNGFFMDFCLTMCPSYSVPDRSSFFVKHIATEATHSSKGGDEIYTIHITTPTRMSFLVEGLVLTGVSTSRQNIFKKLLIILGLYIAFNFTLVVSNTTKNVKKCCALICKKFPWILNCLDPCHQRNLLAKDLVLGSKKIQKIKAFDEVMKIVNSLTNYFSHSNYSKHHLKEAMKDAKDKQGVMALQTSHLRKFVQSGTDENSKFRLQLIQIGRLLNPISRALKTLEGQHTTPSDVFFICIDLAVAFQRAFSDPIYYSDFVLNLNLPPQSQLTQDNAPNLLLWWKARQNNSDTFQLAKLGIKLFSVSTCKMCDKHTASKMGMWSTAKCNGLEAFNIINMGILEKYWKYGSAPGIPPGTRGPKKARSAPSAPGASAGEQKPTWTAQNTLWAKNGVAW